MNAQLASLAAIVTTLPACVALPTGERRAITQAVASQPSSPPEARPLDRSNDAWTIRFVADKRAYNARRYGELQARGRAGDLSVFRKWVRERSKPVEGQPGLTSETRKALQEAFADEIALRMAAYGFTGDQVSALHARSVDVVEALDISKSHVAPLRNAAILAEQVVLGEFIRANLTEDLGDGAGATIRLQVLETLKGNAPVGRVYELRMPAEWTAGQPLASTLKRGDRFLLFPSTARYRHDANLKGSSARPARPFLTFNEMELITVRGDRVQGTHTTPETSLRALRAELKPLTYVSREISAPTAERPTFSQYKPGETGGVSLATPFGGHLTQKGRCLGLTNGDRFTTIIWPATARLSFDRRGLLLKDLRSGAAARLGSYIKITGGLLPAGTTHSLGEDVLTGGFPIECARWVGPWTIGIANPGFRRGRQLRTN